jgi:hypothetical protein
MIAAGSIDFILLRKLIEPQQDHDNVLSSQYLSIKHKSSDCWSVTVVVNNTIATLRVSGKTWIQLQLCIFSNKSLLRASHDLHFSLNKN